MQEYIGLFGLTTHLQCLFGDVDPCCREIGIVIKQRAVPAEFGAELVDPVGQTVLGWGCRTEAFQDPDYNASLLMVLPQVVQHYARTDSFEQDGVALWIGAQSLDDATSLIVSQGLDLRGQIAMGNTHFHSALLAGGGSRMAEAVDLEIRDWLSGREIPLRGQFR